MGRRPDTPATQEAKGNTRKRSSVAMREREARLARLTDLLTPLSQGVEVPSPAYLREPGFEVALAVWKRMAPELMRTHRLPKDSHEAFAIYCCNYAEWLEAQIDINEKGRTQSVKTVAGGRMERDRPSVRHRQTAFDNVMKLSERFGLTPRDMYSLFKDQAMAVQASPSLFDHLPQKAAEELASEAPALAGGVIGSAKRHRSAPPTTVQ